MAKAVILSKEQIIANFLKSYMESLGCAAEITSHANSLTDVSYLIVININNEYSNNNHLAALIAHSQAKVVVLQDIDNNNFTIDGVYIKQIYVDQIFETGGELLSEFINQSRKPIVYVPREAWVGITTLSALSQKIAEELFSFPQNKSEFFGKLVSFREVILSINPTATIYINVNSPQRIPGQNMKVEEPELNIHTLPWINITVSQTKAVATKTQRPKLNLNLPKLNFAPSVPNTIFLRTALAVFVLLFTLPYFLLLFAIGTSAVSYKLFKNGNLEATKTMLKVSEAFSLASYRMLSSPFNLPLSSEASLLAQGTSVGTRVLSATDYSKELTQESLVKLHLELNALYQEVAFIDGEIKDIPPAFSKFFPEVQNIGEYREYLYAASQLSKRSPEILGFDKPKTYLVLFQNNMELRPTGGFIGSFALITISKGELVDNRIYDVYSADGQLKGYIKPPEPIESHLGEASWTLRDSNWDPDFPTSARRAEWFLDKSIDRRVDGVIGVNLEAAKSFLEVVEPVYLLNFNDEIDSKNMYEKVQHEVEDSFFPGSRKKAQYLSALSEALMQRIESSTPQEQVNLIKAAINKLGSRDIQIYLKDQDAQKIVHNQKWDGSLEDGACLKANCHHIVGGVVEANLGVNKANYFINREANVRLELESEYLIQEVSLKLTNTAKTRERIPEERYKTYIRALANNESDFISAYEVSASGRKKLDVDMQDFEGREEYGTLVEVLPGEEKIVMFRYRSKVPANFVQEGEIGYTWWKQSGTGNYPINISFKTPAIHEMRFSPPLSLTESGEYVYNTDVKGDIFIRLNWKKI